MIQGTQVVVLTPDELRTLIRDTVEQAVAARAARGGQRLLTGDAVEEEYGIAKKNLERWRLMGTGPGYVKIGKRVFYPRDVLERFITDNSILTTGRAA